MLALLEAFRKRILKLFYWLARSIYHAESINEIKRKRAKAETLALETTIKSLLCQSNCQNALPVRNERLSSEAVILPINLTKPSLTRVRLTRNVKFSHRDAQLARGT